MRKSRLVSVVVSLFVIGALFSGCSPEMISAIDSALATTTSPVTEAPSATTELAATAAAESSEVATESPSAKPSDTITPSSTEAPTPKPSQVEAIGSISVHFIDVGQGDSILIKAGSAAMLIDAGNPGDEDIIERYIKKQGVEKLNYVIGTHPHADHIGGMASIIKDYPIDKILMPDVDNNTQTYENVLDAVDEKGMTITVPKVGAKYNLANAQFTVLAPNGSGYKDLNNNSIVIRLVFGSTSFLLEGDAEDVSESEMLSKGFDLTSALLKVGHHGSNSSSTLPFLKAVKPKYAVISVGAGNSYGHPAANTLDRLTSVGAEIFRTDLLGTIVATSDGKNITLDKKVSPIKTTAPPTVSKTPSPAKQTAKATAKPTTAPSVKQTTKPSGGSTIVYITDTGTKYHKAGCRYLAKSKHAISLEDAKAQGYTACSVCKPPK